MSEWPSYTFGELCEHSAFGPRFSSDEYDPDGNVACLRTMDIDFNGAINFDAMPIATLDLSRLQNHILRPGDLVITRTGAYLGKAAVFTSFRLPVLPGAFSIRFRLKRSIVDPYFCRYFINSPQGQKATWALATGSAQPNLNIPNLHSLEVQIPPLDVQRRIVELLGSLDDKIEQNRRTSQKLDELARTIFKAWFVDFEPIKSKAAGATSFTGMSPEIFANLPTRLVESELGPVPEGWDVRPIGDLVSLKGGGTPSTKVPEYWDNGIHFWATPKDLSGLQEPILLRTERRITEAGAERISSGVLPENTVLLSSRAPVGYTAISRVPVAINQGFIAMSCDGLLPPHYVLHWTRSNLDEIKSRASGTTFPEISKTAFRPIPAVVPFPKLLTEFESFAQRLFELIESDSRQSQKLAELRNYLLPRLLSGSVRVRE